MNNQTKSIVSAFIAPLILLTFTIIFLFWAYTYGERARMVPVIVGWSMIILCILDVIAVSDSKVGKAVKTFFTGTIIGEAAAEKSDTPTRKIIVAMLWPSSFVALVYFFGFVLLIPFYVFLFVVVQGRKPMKQGLLSAIITTAFIYIVFEKLLQYEVYKGLLFDG